ncbi:NirA family protein [Tautonia plasticadhaerens]|uniref:Sulfite reductase [ferredoxin] n=1 Tax=Tautonia plasticadhaerens TaxID=2527974 RepID=A0A518H4G2_9BACT|nr:NirA family protein [Tautonia plasticadhaerens]QDV35730.1 Sulfite reductase [ferredoxin] [Tautonia plasticadhaerens]
MPESNGFTDVQKHFLQGFVMGADVSRAVRSLPIVSGGGAHDRSGAMPGFGVGGTALDAPPSRPDRVHREAQDRVLASGKALCKEEQAKREKDPFSLWDEMRANATSDSFPRGTDVFLYKFSGLFHVAPAQDSFMCRLRIPGGVVPSWQFRGIADLADRHGGGFADVTTRANLQLREIGPRDGIHVLTGLADLGVINRGAGGDNVRNITSSPTSGIDPVELVETLPLAKELHHHILNHPELHGLPRKFNIAFDGGGKVASLEDTNDVGFLAVRVDERPDSPPSGVYLRLALGGITGHEEFARPTGVLLLPEECVPVASAIIRVFIKNGDRTDRKKARLKYLLDDWGFDRFLSEVESELGSRLRRAPLGCCSIPPPADRWGHVGFHRQKQDGRSYVGVVLPAGRMTTGQMRGLAEVAERFGSGTIRLTVWQNLLISDIAEADHPEVKAAIQAIGLDWDASAPRAGLVACTGNAGCRYAAADTKGHAMALARYLEDGVTLDQPINIHLTGCHHSCAQHYIGDIGLEATKVEVGEEMVEGYHLCIGGGWGEERGIGRRLLDSVPFDDLPPIVERLLRHYLEHRSHPGESFACFARRSDGLELLAAAGVPRCTVA